MKVLKLDREGISSWFSSLAAAGHELFIPVDDPKKGGQDWVLFDGKVPFDVKPGVPIRSVKEFFFPQPETLLRFSKIKSDPEALVMKEPVTSEKKRVLAGVRPCDARSITLNSMPYEDDPYFLKRREQTVVIGLSCSSVCSTCFCVWAGGSPFGKEGLDVAVTADPDNGYIVESLTEKGLKVLEAVKEQSVASGEEISWVEEERKKWAKKGEKVPNPAMQLKGTDLLTLYDAPFWQEISDSCINCGICTFLCPTCYCFDIQDENLRGSGRRIRYWDSCMFPLFTKHASGHNPRGMKLQRCRNRFMHKLRYFPERFGPLSCVGCGRCIKLCPVNIDIREVMHKMVAFAG